MTATAELDAILAHVLAEPDEDVHRLAFADRLDERGEEGDAERAEFIRLQLELDKGEQFDTSGCDVCGNTPDEDGVIEHGRGCYTQDEDGGGTSHADYTAGYCALLNRERELFAAHRDRWFPVPEGYGFDWDIRLTGPFDDRPCYVVRRGFVSSLFSAADVWLAFGDAILAAHPVTDVTLTTEPPLDNIGGKPFLGWGEYSQKKWPRVRFHLPALPRDQYAHWRTAAG